MRDFRSDHYSNNKPRRDFVGQSGSANPQAVNAVFREPVHQVLEKIKNEPFFKRPNKIVGNPERRNHNLYCQDHGHTTKDCRSLWDHLEQLVHEGKLKQLLHHSSGQGSQTSSESRRDVSLRPPLGTINVIFATLGRIGSYPSRITSVARLPTGDINQDPKRVKTDIPPVLGFSDKDKIGTIQPHDDALVITLRIGGYNVKRAMVDQGSGAEIMYHDLYKELNLKPEDLTPYSSPLAGLEVVEVDFIVIDAYSPYTAIMARPWLHTLGVVSSTLHQKVKYSSKGQVNEILEDQSMAKQCLMAAIQHKPEAESLAHAGKDL
ncbi:uncharacterized protein LOC136069074 [Quercus suber]|uniref:uncharacterized protein LOC136069074 n=1 Tax=Quercus suber TaxID=58331 RepID=UPI0032DE3D6E